MKWGKSPEQGKIIARYREVGRDWETSWYILKNILKGYGKAGKN